MLAAGNRRKQQRQPPQQQALLTSGEARALLAIASAASIAAVLVFAEGAFLALLAAAVFDTIMGRKLASGMRRELHAALATVMNAAEQRIRQIMAGIAGNIRKDVERAIAQDLPGGLGARAMAAALGAQPPAVWRNLPALLHMAGLNAIRETDDEFRRVVDEAMKFRTAIGEAVRDLSGRERERLSQSRLRIAQRVLDRFAERGITAFTDSAGRDWDLAAYAEMATRTATARMHLMLYLGAMAPAGIGLLLVYPLTRLPPCGKCAPWVGQVLSLDGSGIGERVPVNDASGQRHVKVVAASLRDAVAAGLFHPSCRHSVIPFTDGAWLPPGDGWPVLPLRNYDAEQKLRGLEREMRQAKRLRDVALSAEARSAAQREIARLEQKIKELTERYGLQRLRYREQSYGAR